MADYFYASYHFDVPLPSGSGQVETSTLHPWRARLASFWTFRPEIRQCLQKGVLPIILGCSPLRTASRSRKGTRSNTLETKDCTLTWQISLLKPTTNQLI